MTQAGGEANFRSGAPLAVGTAARAEAGGGHCMLCPPPAGLTREVVARLVADYLARGGIITICPSTGDCPGLPHALPHMLQPEKVAARRARGVRAARFAGRRPLPEISLRIEAAE